MNEHEDKHELERNWNKNKTPARPHTPDPTRHSWGSNSSSLDVRVGGLHFRKGSTSPLNNHDLSPKRNSTGTRDSSHTHLHLHKGSTSPLNNHNLSPKRNATGPRNSPHVHLHRQDSHQKVTTPTDLEQPRTRSLLDPSKLGLLNGHRQRTHSDAGSSRASSPASSISSSHSAKDGSEDEIIHQRERNWNAPLAKWTRHDHSSKHDYPSREAESAAMKNSQPYVQGEGKAQLADIITHTEHKADSPVPSLVQPDKSNSTIFHERPRLSHLQDEAKLRALTFSRDSGSRLPIRSPGKEKASKRENGRPTGTNSVASVSSQLHGTFSSDRHPTPQKISYPDSSESDSLPPINTIHGEDQNNISMHIFRPQFVLLRISSPSYFSST